MHRRDALRAQILPTIFEWHVGQEVNGIGAQQGALDPIKFLISWQRGDAMSADVLSPDWDFFGVAERDLEELLAVRDCAAHAGPRGGGQRDRGGRNRRSLRQLS
jgi:hypothetical protein